MKMLPTGPSHIGTEPEEQVDLANALSAALSRIADLEEEAEAIRAAAAADLRLLQDFVADLRARIDRELEASTPEFADLVVNDAAEFQACLEELERAFAARSEPRPTG